MKAKVNLKSLKTISDAFGGVRASTEGLREYQNFASTGGFEYSAESGWHFYSYLKIKPKVEKDGDAGDVRRLASLYKNYTFAADMAARASKRTCHILEHQGNIIHFFFPGTDSKVEALVDFAKGLTALVETYVLGYYESDVLRFNMAAQHGQSIIIHAPSPTGEESSISIVSLGPCANYPAKRMVERIPDYECPFSWWNGKDWQVAECHVSEEKRRVLRESYAQDSLYVQFDRVIGPDESFGEETADIRNGQRRREAFFFRADMDGFTRRVDDAFKKNSQHALVEEFIEYMRIAKAWQVSSPFVQVISHPWAGDCCNVEIVGTSANRFSFADLRGSEPLGIIRDWERYVQSDDFSHFSYGKQVKWTYSVGGGVIYDFVVKTNDRQFKLSVGRPVGRTYAGVNFKENSPEWLVMHVDDVSRLPDEEKKTFHAYVGFRHPNFRYQDSGCRRQADDAAAEVVALAAAPSVEHGISLVKTRPWISEED